MTAADLDALVSDIKALRCGLWVYTLDTGCSWDVVDWLKRDEYGAPVKVANGESVSFSRAIIVAHAAAAAHRNSESQLQPALIS